MGEPTKTQKLDAKWRSRSGQPGSLRGALPAHMQISEMLIREIMAGRLADGTRLPPEREMAAGLKVAIGTLRRGLQDLQDKGLLERIQGSGNYVRAREELLGVYAFFRLELVGGGGLPSAVILSVDKMSKPTDLPSFGPSPDVHRIRRLRRLSGKSAALEEIWLDGARAETLRAEDLSDSLYLHYRLALGFTVEQAEDRVGVGAAPEWSPPEFAPQAGATVGYIERFASADDGQEVEYSQTWFDPNVARYVTRFR